MNTGIVIFAHGSSVEAANEGVRAVSRDVASRGGYELVETAFLEGGRPLLPEAVDSLVARGARRVLVVPFFLTLGIHLQRDLPRIVDDLAAIHNGVRIEITPPMEGHPALQHILLDRLREALG